MNWCKMNSNVNFVSESNGVAGLYAVRAARCKDAH